MRNKGASVPDQALAVPATPANAVDGPSGFDPSRIEEYIAGPGGGRIKRECIKVGRLLVHANPNSAGCALTHSGTGGQILVRQTEDEALVAARHIEGEYSDALDVLDLLDWGQQLTDKMRRHPAIARLRLFRERAQ